MGYDIFMDTNNSGSFVATIIRGYRHNKGRERIVTEANSNGKLQTLLSATVDRLNKFDLAKIERCISQRTGDFLTLKP